MPPRWRISPELTKSFKTRLSYDNDAESSDTHGGILGIEILLGLRSYVGVL